MNGNLVAFVGLLWLACLLALDASADEPISSFEVEAAFSPPERRFGLSGLAWDGTSLWSCNADNGKIYKHNMDDPLSVLGEYASPGGSPYGLAWDGQSLWSVDWKTNRIYKHHMDSNLSVAAEFDGRATYFLVGLAWDGEHLWSTDAELTGFPYTKIRKHNMDSTLSIAFEANAPVTSGGFAETRGLSFSDQEKDLWSTNYLGDRPAIYRYNMDSTLSVANSYRLPGLQRGGWTGLAWIDDNLWIGNFFPGKRNRVIYKLRPIRSGAEGIIEAESMQLQGYRTQALDFASNGALISLKGSSVNGSAKTTYTGATGQYDIFVVYHDENDGDAMLTITIGGVSVDSWVLRQRIGGGQQPEEFNRFKRRVASDFVVFSGDEVRVDGVQGNWDHANVDYIEFRRSQLPVPNRIEAESMQLVNYRVETQAFASGRALINLKGPGSQGSATTNYVGESGRYNVILGYHDENDGVARLDVSIGGSAVDGWMLDERIPHGEQPQELNRFTRRVAADITVNNGDEIHIHGTQGNWDHANIDYIEFQSVP